MSDHPLWKVVLVCAVLAGMAALTVAIYLSDRPASRPVAAATPTPSPALSARAPSPTPVRPSPTPTPSPSPTLDPRLIELRATDQYEELAEAPRAALAQYSRLAYENFAPRVNREPVDWPNKDEVWNSLAPAFRDEALLLGREYDLPLWNNSNARPTTVQAMWFDETTGGRGYVFTFKATYENGGRVRIRYWPLLIKFDETLRGRVVSVMPPLEHAESDFPGLVEESAAIGNLVWEWVMQQPVVT